MKLFKQIVALVVIVLIPFGLMLWFRTHNTTGFASVELIVYPLLFGGISILVLYFLKKYFLKEKITDFNSGKGKWTTDILFGFALTVVYFILFYIERITLTDVLTFKPNMELLGLMLDMRKSPLLLILWFGPVLWVGIALYEELVRVFILTSLWQFSKVKIWKFTVIIISGLIIGLAHWSQGSYGIVTIALKGIVSALFFYRYRRFLPLVIAHVLYDGLQVALLLITYPQ